MVGLSEFLLQLIHQGRTGNLETLIEAVTSLGTKTHSFKATHQNTNNLRSRVRSLGVTNHTHLKYKQTILSY